MWKNVTIVTGWPVFIMHVFILTSIVSATGQVWTLRLYYKHIQCLCNWSFNLEICILKKAGLELIFYSKV